MTLIIFDCDGVLIDSEIIAARFESEAAASVGYAITPDEVCARFAGMPTRVVWDTIEAEMGVPLPPNFREEHHARVEAAFLNELVQIYGVEEAIGKLNHPFCVASSTRKPNLEINLQTTGLFDYFNPNIFSASQVARPKPFPDVFEFAAAQMGFAPHQCLVIEDSVPGVKAAIAAKMKVIGFCGGSHIQEGHAHKLRENGAIEVFDNMQKLNSMIDKFI